MAIHLMLRNQECAMKSLLKLIILFHNSHCFPDLATKSLSIWMLLLYCLLSPSLAIAPPCPCALTFFFTNFFLINLILPCWCLYILIRTPALKWGHHILLCVYVHQSSWDDQTRYLVRYCNACNTIFSFQDNILYKQLFPVFLGLMVPCICLI